MLMLPAVITWKLKDLDIDDLNLEDPDDLLEFEYYLADCICTTTGYYINDFSYNITDSDVTVTDIEYDFDEEDSNYAEEDN